MSSHQGGMPDDEYAIRLALWLGHGHARVYGDDGEMQCGECARFGEWDYRRAPIPELVKTAFAALAFIIDERRTIPERAPRER